MFTRGWGRFSDSSHRLVNNSSQGWTECVVSLLYRPGPAWRSSDGRRHQEVKSHRVRTNARAATCQIAKVAQKPLGSMPGGDGKRDKNRTERTTNRYTLLLCDQVIGSPTSPHHSLNRAICRAYYGVLCSMAPSRNAFNIMSVLRIQALDDPDECSPPRMGSC